MVALVKRFFVLEVGSSRRPVRGGGGGGGVDAELPWRQD